MHGSSWTSARTRSWMTASLRSGSEKLGRPLVHSWEVVDGVTGRVVVRKFGYVEAYLSFSTLEFFL